MKLYASFPDDLADWAQRQPVFFTGSAGTHGRHVNVSPKGMADTHFAVLSPSRCAYIDRTGSGCETIAHAYENGRLCLLFISFGSMPRILRVFCRARVVEWDQPAFPGLVHAIAKGKRDVFDAARAVIVGDVWEVQTSCGFGVPRVKRALYAPDEDGAAADGTAANGTAANGAAVNGAAADGSLRDVLRQGQGGDKLDELAVFEMRHTLDSFSSKTVQNNTLRKYQRDNSAASIDGLRGLRTARRDLGRPLWIGDAAARARRVFAEAEAVAAGFGLAVVLYVLLAGLRLLFRSRSE